MENAFKLTVNDEGIASLVFDLPEEKINKFTIPVMEEFEKVLDNVAQDKRIKAMTISSGKEDIFIAGADLHSFEPVFKDPSKGAKIISTGHRVFNKLQNLPFPTIALIQGACLGGGMEMALACTYRVVSDNPKTQLGLPEVTLGIIPGWGGTQRMPRLVGLTEGLSMVLGGKPVKANKAAKIGLVDAIYSQAFFDEGVKQFLKQCLSIDGAKKIKDKRNNKGWSSLLLESNPLGRAIIYKMAEKDVLKHTKGHYPAPMVALDLIKETYPLPLSEGLAKEEKTFVDKLSSSFSIAPNLIHLFFLSEALKKDKGVAGDVKPLPVSSVGVIGAGTMGSGIAWLFSNKDIPVRMKDVDWQALSKGLGNISSIYAKGIKEKKLRSNEASLKFHHISGTTDYSGFKDQDLVIEAAVENLDLKHQVLKELEGLLRPNAIMASNTSSLKIADMAKVLTHPERFIGMHFFNPANKMPLVEVIPSDKTSPQVIATAVEVCKKMGKTPIVVKDCAGFLVNRVFILGANEVIRMYQEGVDKEKLNQMMLDFGMPMAPFILADEVGNDVGYKVSQVLEEAYGSRMQAPELLKRMYDNKLLGKKVGKGFYLYDGKNMKDNPEVEQMRKSINDVSKSIPDEDLRDRVFLSMINEASRCLEENVVANAATLDMGMIMGIGFPPFRGGLLKYADDLGIDYVVNGLNRLKELYGERFTPSKLLIDMQANHKTFYS